MMVESGNVNTLARARNCADILERFKTRSSHAVNIVIATPDGMARCMASPKHATLNIADRAYFLQALNATEPIIGEAIVGRINKKLSLPLAQSFLDSSGKVEGVLAVLLDLNWVNNELAIADVPPGARLGLIDSAGTVLARYPDPDHMIGRNFKDSLFFKTLMLQKGSGTAETFGFDGVLRVFAFSTFTHTSAGPIYLWVGMTKASVLEHAQNQFYADVAFAFALAAVSFGAVWIGADRLVIRPIEAIVVAARRLSKGDHLARTGVPHSQDEIGQLAGAFDDMALALLSNNEILRLNRSLEVLSRCNKILVHAKNEEQLLNDICRTIIEVGGYRMVWVGYAMDDEHKTVQPVAHYGHEEGYLNTVQITWDETERGRGPTGTAIRTGTSQFNKNFSTNLLMKPWQESAISRGYRSSSTFPLMANGQVLGALTIYSAVVDPFSVAEVTLLEELSDDLAFGITSLRLSDANARNLKRLESSLEATVQAMAATLELRDPYTAGHQRRVSELATAIAQEMGMSEDEIHGIHLASVIHDLGKIQVPAEILVKPSRLDEYEFKLIQRHPKAGYDILKNIDFPWPIAELVRQHHERIDGSGYPQGLKGDEILPGAKILAIADVVEAMSSHRPYRPALGIEVALEEIIRNKGKFYDIAAADVCIKLFRNKKFAFSK